MHCIFFIFFCVQAVVIYGNLRLSVLNVLTVLTFFEVIDLFHTLRGIKCKLQPNFLELWRMKSVFKGCSKALNARGVRSLYIYHHATADCVVSEALLSQPGMSTTASIGLLGTNAERCHRSIVYPQVTINVEEICTCEMKQLRMSWTTIGEQTDGC